MHVCRRQYAIHSHTYILYCTYIHIIPHTYIVGKMRDLFVISGMDKAGSYGIQGHGAQLVTGIQVCMYVCMHVRK